ncbi:MAG TPA: N-6 DNA methylase [Candidatus Paceibacterota bacterium]|nr:N-6 DNA methylase [Candidatus Paceibacterota bacterium]
MDKNPNKYISEIAKYYSDPNSSEHSYRTTFENYLKEIFPTKDGYFTQQDQKAINGNKPDFVILKNKIPILYIEVKKVGEDLDKIEKSNQADRYFGYGNLIISDYVDFRFFRNGQKYGENISLANVDKKIFTISDEKDISTLSQTILDFVSTHKEKIKRGKHLAQIMGGKARRIRDNVREMLQSENNNFSDLITIKNIIKENLIHSLDNDSFADMYAQTLVYGLFAARYNDDTPDNFSRQEARDLVPKSNPFLRSFFDHIAGDKFPDRLRYIVDELCEVFSHANIQELLSDFYGQEKENHDPVIHFYEDFLKEYDAKKKMDMGVFYTPQPVVRFIIRAVDEILKTEFGLQKGLADNTKISLEEAETNPKTGKKIKSKKEYHKVQILDIATGTGTFLNEAIHHIKNTFKGQDGRWESYVKSDLLPRLHGFELMMASYTIAHLKLGMTLHDTGVTDLTNRLGVYLTNTLEEPKESIWGEGSLFVGVQESISKEAIEASKIKSKYPIMCVIGNPPYSVSSSNKGEYITNLISVYKKELKERNIQPLSDDYIKFIRFAENLVEKNNSGIVAMITNNSFIDGIIHRQMRKHLLQVFDKIYILNLSPRNKKGDQNVFDIKQGVSINIFVKSNSNKNALGECYYSEIVEKREQKFNILENSNLSDINWKKIEYFEPHYFFVPKDFSENKDYEKGFKIDDIFMDKNAGVATGKDDIFVKDSVIDLEKTLNEIKLDFDPKDIKIYNYRIFDKKYFIYDNKLIQRLRERIMKHFLSDNLGLISTKILSSESYYHVFITKDVGDRCVISNKGKEANYFFPLYLYTNQNEKIPNLDKEIWKKIDEIVGKTTPENILDYIYAVLHSPNYREKYKEFLKIDFPRVPFPADKNKFWQLVKFGEKLRNLHLMIDSNVNNFITTFPNSGSDTIEKITYKNGDVYINSEQYFGNVPEIAWNFYIGGYQPAQKWLKDRKGRKLSNDDIEHYQKIIVVLAETERVMGEIDGI